jgi:hypothetical protein
MKTRCLRIVSIALLACVVAGCGGGDDFDRVPLSGTVTCEGMESINGGILAMPTESGTSAPNASAPIADGKFSFPEGQAPVAGTYIFEVNLQVPGQQPAPGESPEGEVETGPEITFRKTIDVPEGGTDSLSIDLTSADRVGEEGEAGDIPASGEM